MIFIKIFDIIFIENKEGSKSMNENTENTENMQCDETYNPDLLTWGNLHNIDDYDFNIRNEE